MEEVEGEDVKKRSSFYIEWAEKCKKDVLELVKDGLLEVSEVLKEEDVKGDYLYIPVEGGLPGTASFDEEVSLEEEVHQTFAMSCIADVARFYSLFSGRGFLEEFDYRYDKNKVVFIEMEQELLKYFQKIRADGSDSKFARTSVYLDWKRECQDHLRKEFIARIEDHVERLEIEGYLR